MSTAILCTREQVFSGPLVLVNAAHPLAPAAPPALAAADPDYPGVLLERDAARLLWACIQRVGGGGEIVPVSGWRSQAQQQRIWDETLERRGAAFTRSYVALPGCSEHQTGLAIDLALNRPHIDLIRPHFPGSGVCGAFRRLAAGYGFILRYPAEKQPLTGIACEPWHFRYVGAPHARLMEENGLCLEEYAGFLRAAPRACPLSGGRRARVFYVPCAGAQTEIELPGGCCQVSGDNVDGFIVTTWEDRP